MGRIILIGGVLFLGFISFVSSINMREPHSIQLRLTVEFTQQVVGGLMALIGALGILWDWREEGSLSRFAASTVVLLAGISLSSSSWGSCLALAAIVIASRFPFSGDRSEQPYREGSHGSSRSEDEPPKWLDR